MIKIETDFSNSLFEKKQILQMLNSKKEHILLQGSLTKHTSLIQNS